VATFRANERAFVRRVATLEGRERQLGAAHHGQGVAVTEAVPLYLLAACGLVNRTPSEFSKAVEDGTDVSPRVLQQTLDLFSGRAVKALVYNAQTTGPQTDRIKSAAQSAGVPIVAVTETLPAGQTYYTWMRAQLDALASALGNG
jgi:zinc/manganese transport system substrate-binding protein